MNQSTQVIANTVLKWDAPQNEPASVEVQVDRISGWHAAAKHKVTLACQILENEKGNTDVVIALHKALGWIDEAEGWTQGILQQPVTPVNECATPEPTFLQELAGMINRRSMESESDTPDYILAEYLTQCLKAYESAVRARHIHRYGSDMDGTPNRKTTQRLI